jgi:hypothetical protein
MVVTAIEARRAAAAEWATRSSTAEREVAFGPLFLRPFRGLSRERGGTRRPFHHATVGTGLSPRARGNAWVTKSEGLSPRARGNGQRSARDARQYGSIPASAGERSSKTNSPCLRGVYPRERGGTSRGARQPRSCRGLSPRASGERLSDSAHRPEGRVYPRERGGTLTCPVVQLRLTGLSPRARGNGGHGRQRELSAGSIPASAGERPRSETTWTSGRVYPRERGGTGLAPQVADPLRGLSRRARGNGIGDEERVRHLRSIPASAGERLPFKTLISLMHNYKQRA